MYKLIISLIIAGFVAQSALTVKTDFTAVRGSYLDKLEQVCDK